MLKSASSTSSGNDATSNVSASLLPDLASYFRYNAYEKERAGKGHATGVDEGNARIENMLMYSILVVQSVILFIAYIKRLFYVLILGMMGPIVVVFDFFQKFGR